MPYNTLFRDLKNSRERLREIVDSIADWIWEIDSDGRYTFCSKKIENILGYIPEEMIGKTPFDFMVPDDVKKNQDTFNKIVTAKTIIKNFEHWNICKDGRHICLLTNGVPILDKNGDLLGFHGIDRDITKSKLAEIALRKSEEKFKATFRTSPDAINLNAVTDGVYIDINEGFTKIMDYTREDVIGESSVELNIWNDIKDRERMVSELKKYGLVENLEAEFIGKNGRIRTGLMSARILQIDNQDVILSITRDITEQRKLKSQLRQAQKMESIGTLAGGIAHDFNNILFPIIGHTEMLLEDVPEDSPLRDSLNGIYSGAIRAGELVKQILTFSRQDMNGLKLIKIQPVIKEALKLIRSAIPTTIEIKQTIQADFGVIKADPTQIHQIVMNLCTNAYHAMEETGGELMVSLKEIKFRASDLMNPNMTPGGYACLTIADTGKGMDKNLTKKIFDPFFTTKEIGKGTGMGLSVVHGIVSGMKGAVHVYSEPGKGTEFYVYLPLVKSPSGKKKSHQTKEPIQGGMERILLVDDEDAVITMEKLMLERLGYQVASFTSSIEALEVFRVNPDRFDLVITDMAMPDMPGNQLSIKLTKIRPDIPVLLCTGFSETMSKEKAASLGIKGFLLKPIVMQDLSQKIREVLNKK